MTQFHKVKKIPICVSITLEGKTQTVNQWILRDADAGRLPYLTLTMKVWSFLQNKYENGST